jgi:hypothetical protein
MKNSYAALSPTPTLTASSNATNLFMLSHAQFLPNNPTHCSKTPGVLIRLLLQGGDSASLRSLIIPFAEEGEGSASGPS